ncbi:MAG: galactokinase [Acidobacteria bacterium]|nr:galactokinase [Acidobacteriota bacterium]
MNAHRLISRLAERGLDAPELPAKRALYERALKTFEQSTGRLPEHAWWVPGRLEVFGKHTDYAGGRTLVAAVPRGIALLAAPGADGIVTVTDAHSGDHVTLGSSQPARALTGWRAYVNVVVGRLARNFPGVSWSADIVFASDLPRASGMSSSSVLVVGVATALARLADLASRAEWQANIRGPLDAAGYFGCIENGSRFGALTGDDGVGTHGGSEDHTAILCATRGHVSAYAFMPVRHIASARVPNEWQFVIASSGVRAQKTGAAREAYNRLSRGTQILLELWRTHESSAPSLAAALAADTSAPERLIEAVRRSDISGWNATSLERRLAHFVREDARVPEALRAFQAADAAAIASIAAASQAEAETLLGNQVPETIALVRSALRLGAIAANGFGAGFGGSVWALVQRDAALGFGARWLDAYESPYAPRAVAFVAAPGPPLTELSSRM